MKAPEKSLIFVVGLSLIVGTIPALGATTSSKRSVSSAKIGVLAPLTGKFADIGKDFKNGLEVAAADINASGKRVELVYEDSAAEPKTALAAFRKLTAVNGVQIIIAGPGSSANLAVAPAAESQRVLFFAHSKTPKLDDAGDYIFRFLPMVEGEVTRLVRYLNVNKIKRVALIYDAASDTQTYQQKLFAAIFMAKGGVVVAAEGYDSKTINDFRSILTKLEATNPDALYLIAIDKVAGLAVKQARELGLTVPIFGWSTYESDQFLTVAGDVAEGVVFTAEPFSCRGTKQMRSYCAAYAKRFGDRKPQYYGAYAYDNLMLIAKTLSRQPAKIRTLQAAMARVRHYSGTAGQYSFDNKGNLYRGDFVIRTVRNGKFIDLK